MPLLEFVGQSVRDDDFRAGNSGRLVNCYRYPTEEGHVLKSTLGTVAFATLPAVFLRDMEEVQGTIYAAAGGALYSIDSAGNETSLGSITNGVGNLSSNNGDVTVAANGDYYVWDGATLSTPSTGAFSAVGSVEFLSQYTVLTEQNGRRFQWSDIADASTFDALDFATAEGRDDAILRAVAVNGRLVLFKETSREVWYVTGQAGVNAFQRLAGGVVDTGLKAYGLVAKIDQGAFFVGDDDIAYVTDGMGQRVVSNPAVSTSIAQSTPDRCFYYEDEGHKFCVIRFLDRPAWVLDLTTLEWHERAWGVDFDPFPGVASVKLGANWYVGGDDGEVYRLTRNNTDVAGAMVRRAVSRTLKMDGQRFRLQRLEMYARVGNSDIGRDAQCWLRLSRDGGLTWGRERWASLGSLGEYDKRLVWRALGQYRDVAAEVNVSDPAELPIKAQAVVELQ